MTFLLVYSSWIFVKSPKMGSVFQCKLGALLDRGDFVPPDHFYNKTKVRLVARSTLLVKTLRPYYEPAIKWLTALNSLRGGRCCGTIFSVFFLQFFLKACSSHSFAHQVWQLVHQSSLLRIIYCVAIFIIPAITEEHLITISCAATITISKLLSGGINHTKLFDPVLTDLNA